jgi:cobalt-zinc-cadmium efflux system membrane fusion protein
MKRILNSRTAIAWAALAVLLQVACDGRESHSEGATALGSHGQETAAPEAKGPNGGRLLTSSEFQLELAIFERAVPPEFRAWVTMNGQPVAPAEVSLQVKLARLGGRVDEIAFAPQGDFLRGDSVIYEPHSFEVAIEAVHDGKKHTWEYESFEGRTRIDAEIAKALGVRTAIAGEAVLHDIVRLYGRIRANPERVRELRARFDGVVRDVHAELGARVQKGDKLLTIESNESLNPYSITAPIGGVVTQRDANPGEQTSGRVLLTITDTSSVWADLSVFPGDRARVRVGSPVSIASATGGSPALGTISTLEVFAREDQSVVARAVLENPEGEIIPGTFVAAEVTAGEHSVPVAVKKTGLQAFRGFTVVYAQVGEEYEVRMLELGRDAKDYVEVLGGLEAGTRYVAANSYLIKADIEKSGASHDH